MLKITKIFFTIILSLLPLLSIYPNPYKKIQQVLLNKEYSEALSLLQHPENILTGKQYNKLLLIAIDWDTSYNIFQFLINKVASFPDIKERALSHVLFRMLGASGNYISDGFYLHKAQNSLSLDKKLYILKLIFNLGISPNIYMCSIYGPALLLHAMVSEQPDTIIRYLLLRGANIHLQAELVPTGNIQSQDDSEAHPPSLKEVIVEMSNDVKKIIEGVHADRSDAFLELIKDIKENPQKIEELNEVTRLIALMDAEPSETLFRSSIVNKFSQPIFAEDLIQIKTQK